MVTVPTDRVCPFTMARDDGPVRCYGNDCAAYRTAIHYDYWEGAERSRPIWYCARMPRPTSTEYDYL